MTLLLAAIAVLIGGGLLAVITSRSARLASALGASSAFAGGAIGVVFALGALRTDQGDVLALAWQVPGGAFHVAVDPLSAFFLVPVFGVPALAAVYGHDYLLAYRAHKSLGLPWLAFNVLVASMAVVLVARQAVLFLVAWEVMSLSGYVLVTFENEDREVSRAGWTYLVATHIGTACLVALFLLLGRRASSFDFDAFAAAAGHPAPYALMLALAIVGFGTKAGFVPCHVWLPEAHAAAPSHVSAVMSGVLVKMGLYGLLRTLLLLGPRPTVAGPLLAAIGFVGASVGIMLSLYQRDMKRALAYSSIENVGIITIGLGVSFWGSAVGLPNVAELAMAGALLHVWNHALMKSLMFLGAGSVLHGCGTKDLEKLGGVLRRMPRTGTLLIFGAVALAALPPLNGFVSEWLVYLALIQAGLSGGGTAGVLALLAVGAVSIIGGLAVLSFVRLVGTALLGEPRSEQAARAHESPVAMIAPMAALALGSLAVAVAPGAVVRATSHAAAQLLDGATEAEAPAAQLATIGTVQLAVCIALALTALLTLVVFRRRAAARGPTWDCGYARPTPRMQYTAASFSELAAGSLVPRALRPRVSVSAPEGLFPHSGTLSTECSDPITRGVYEPLLVRIADGFTRQRWLQQGHLHVYLLYMVVALLIAFGWASLR